MQFFKKTTNLNFMAKRRPFMVLSLIAVITSVILVLTLKPKFGIDFVGGTEIQVKFTENVTPAKVRTVLKSMGFDGYEVVSFGAGDSEYLIRLREITKVDDSKKKSVFDSIAASFGNTQLGAPAFSPNGEKLTVRLNKELPISEMEAAVEQSGLELGAKLEQAAQASTDDETKTSKRCESATCTWPNEGRFIYEISLQGVSDQVVEELRKQTWGSGAVKMRSEWVGQKVGEQLRNAGLQSILFALAFIMLYIAIRFDLRFAPGAVVALIHDICITLGIFTIFRVEVTLATVAALLTIVGYSLNDTIVVFDRIRENLSKIKERKLSAVINLSLNETLSRTILTSLTTLLAVGVLLTIGWKTSLRDFSFALAVGVFIGTYSSIFVASPIVGWLDQFFAKKKA